MLRCSKVTCSAPLCDAFLLFSHIQQPRSSEIRSSCSTVRAIQVVKRKTVQLPLDASPSNRRLPASRAQKSSGQIKPVGTALLFALTSIAALLREPSPPTAHPRRAQHSARPGAPPAPSTPSRPHPGPQQRTAPPRRPGPIHCAAERPGRSGSRGPARRRAGTGRGSGPTAPLSAELRAGHGRTQRGPVKVTAAASAAPGRARPGRGAHRSAPPHPAPPSGPHMASGVGGSGWRCSGGRDGPSGSGALRSGLAVRGAAAARCGPRAPGAPKAPGSARPQLPQCSARRRPALVTQQNTAAPIRPPPLRMRVPRESPSARGTARPPRVGHAPSRARPLPPPF